MNFIVKNLSETCRRMSGISSPRGEALDEPTFRPPTRRYPARLRRPADEFSTTDRYVESPTIGVLATV